MQNDFSTHTCNHTYTHVYFTTLSVWLLDINFSILWVNFRARYNHRNTWPRQKNDLIFLFVKSRASLENSSFNWRYLYSSCLQKRVIGNGRQRNCYLFIFSNLEKSLILVLHSGYQPFLSLTCIIFPYTHFFQDHIWPENDLTGNLFCKQFMFDLCGMTNNFHFI